MDNVKIRDAVEANIEVVLCPQCGGTGYIRPKDVLVQHSLYDSDWEEQPIHQCITCQGAGRLLKETVWYALPDNAIVYSKSGEILVESKEGEQS